MHRHNSRNDISYISSPHSPTPTAIVAAFNKQQLFYLTAAIVLVFGIGTSYFRSLALGQIEPVFSLQLVSMGGGGNGYRSVAYFVNW